MSCPHVAGIVALIKSARPDWSPAAIKSALMTTSYRHDTTMDIILAGGTTKVVDPFDIGSGHVDPIRAIDPGLIYDIETEHYILFLCSLGYSEDKIKRMIVTPRQVQVNCQGKHSDTELNYPSITISDLLSTTTLKRTLTNVGDSKIAIYFANVASIDGVEIILWPRLMVFTAYGQKRTYYVTVTPTKRSRGRYGFGEIIWFDGYHHVRTPLIVRVNNIDEDEESAATHTTI